MFTSSTVHTLNSSSFQLFHCLTVPPIIRFNPFNRFNVQLFHRSTVPPFNFSTVRLFHQSTRTTLSSVYPLNRYTTQLFHRSTVRPSNCSTAQQVEISPPFLPQTFPCSNVPLFNYFIDYDLQLTPQFTPSTVSQFSCSTVGLFHRSTGSTLSNF